MTDAELATFLGLSEAEAHLVSKIKPDKRAVYERMAEVEIELGLWQAGLGPKPSGVIVTKGRR
jgi:hypothetical protein